MDSVCFDFVARLVRILSADATYELEDLETLFGEYAFTTNEERFCARVSIDSFYSSSRPAEDLKVKKISYFKGDLDERIEGRQPYPYNKVEFLGMFILYIDYIFVEDPRTTDTKEDSLRSYLRYASQARTKYLHIWHFNQFDHITSVCFIPNFVEFFDVVRLPRQHNHITTDLILRLVRGRKLQT